MCHLLFCLHTPLLVSCPVCMQSISAAFLFVYGLEGRPCSGHLASGSSSAHPKHLTSWPFKRMHWGLG